MKSIRTNPANGAPQGDEFDPTHLPEDGKCPKCGHHMAYDDGAYYCDCTHGETFGCRCEWALKRRPSL